MMINKNIDWKKYIANKTSEFNQNIPEGLYRKYFNRECNLALGTLVTASLLYPSAYSDGLLAVSGVTAADIVIRAINGNHGERAASGLVGLTREIYENLTENEVDKTLKSYKNRIKELREHPELVEKLHSIATQQPSDKFRGDSVDSGSAFYSVGNHTFGNGETIPVGILVLSEDADQYYTNSRYKWRLLITGASILLINQEYDSRPKLITARIFGLLKKGPNYIGFISEDFGKLSEERIYLKGLEKLFQGDLDHIVFTNWLNKNEELKYFAIDFNTTSPREESKQKWWPYKDRIEESLDEFVIKIN